MRKYKALFTVRSIRNQAYLILGVPILLRKGQVLKVSIKGKGFKFKGC